MFSNVDEYPAVIWRNILSDMEEYYSVMWMDIVSYEEGAGIVEMYQNKSNN